ncbi:MAG TPA: acetamidase/formamidase family protein [Acidobacteriota bacterium]|nr:acetamidase/formamidase family protein [Acidobacteriota bacterium]HNB72423.1 acetamidase/formamidase family protein [Acidobacteriota bacterium]HND18442.1 acetamidase/formamidase family protein [Acidobacteriota bacterium]
MATMIPKNHSVYCFSSLQSPVCEVAPGTVLTFETSDEQYERLSRGESVQAVRKLTNPVTGPVAIQGALKGDAVCVEVLDIQITRAWAVWVPNLGSLGHKTQTVQVKEIPIQNNTLQLSPRLRVDLDPMIGCIGVAPKKGIGSTVAPAGRWGGNMDLRELRIGTRLWLPVFHPGGLLSIGDLHAAMGTGEPTCIAIETSGQVTVRIDLIPKAGIESPRLFVPGATLCVGIGQSIEQAQLSAIDQAYQILTEKFGLSDFEAYAYASAKLELRFGGPASPIALAVIPDPVF